MKIIDKYLIKQFLQTLSFGLLTFVVLFIIINLFEQLGSFVDNKASASVIIQYYTYFTPEIIRLVLPVAVLLACLFTSGKMSNLNELTAIKAGGISLYRFMLPFVVTTFLICLFSIYFGGYVVPEANKKVIAIEHSYMGLGYYTGGNNIFFQDSRTRIVSIATYDIQRNVAIDVSIQDFSPDDVTKMVSRIDASRMSYDKSTKSWRLTGAVKKEFFDQKQVEKTSMNLTISDLNFVPKDIINKQLKKEEMTLSELSGYAKDQVKAGNDPTETYIEFHSRIALAFSPLIVIMFGLPIASHKRKGGLALQFGLNLLITFVYLVFMKISQAFGKNGILDPISTAWFANLVFLIGALYNIRRSR